MSGVVLERPRWPRWPFCGVDDLHVAAARGRVVSAKMLRMSSSTMSTFLPCQHRVLRSCSCLEHPLLRRPAAGRGAVQEERGLLEQPLGRAGVLETIALATRSSSSSSSSERSLPVWTMIGSWSRPVSSLTLLDAARSRSCRAGAGRAPCSRTAASRAPARPRPPCRRPAVSTSSPEQELDEARPLRGGVLDDEQVLLLRGRRTS